MNIQSVFVGQKVRHPQYGTGSVKSITDRTAEIWFDDGTKRVIAPEESGLEPAEATASVTGLDVPLSQFVSRIVGSVIKDLGLEKANDEIEELGLRWQGGRLVMHPADSSLQPKEVPLETFFHKIVMMRNNLRVLEQKINGHEKLSDGEKVEMQQYITRCYGSMTTFNVLFKNKADQFGGASS